METSPPIFMSKVCSTCKRELPVEQFREAPGYKGNRVGQCKGCVQERQNAWRRRRDVQQTPVGLIRRCNGCDQDLPAEAFVRDKNRKFGLTSFCRDCWAVRRRIYREQAGPEVNARYTKRSRKKNYGDYLERHLRRVYDMSLTDYLVLLERQQGVCCLCGRLNEKVDGRIKPLEVDHVHDDTGRVRGLLCGRCNTALGWVGDDHAWLVRAAKYVKVSELPQRVARRERA